MRILKISVITLLVSAGLAVLPNRAAASDFEVSLGFSFNRSNYSDDNFSWNRRWGASVSYELSSLTEIEFSFQDVVDRTSFAGYEDTKFHDQIFSVSWVQNLLSRNFAVQPYVKAGVGQLNRDAEGSYWYGGGPPSRVDSVTGVAAAGFRVFVTRTFAIRAEATSYLAGGSIVTWKDNAAVTFGISAKL